MSYTYVWGVPSPPEYTRPIKHSHRKNKKIPFGLDVYSKGGHIYMVVLQFGCYSLRVWKAGARVVLFQSGMYTYVRTLKKFMSFCVTRMKRPEREGGGVNLLGCERSEHPKQIIQHTFSRGPLHSYHQSQSVPSIHWTVSTQKRFPYILPSLGAAPLLYFSYSPKYQSMQHATVYMVMLHTLLYY